MLCMIEKVGLIKDGVLTRLIFRHTVGRQQHQKWILVPAASVASALMDHADLLSSAIDKIFIASLGIMPPGEVRRYHWSRLKVDGRWYKI